MRPPCWSCTRSQLALGRAAAALIFILHTVFFSLFFVFRTLFLFVFGETQKTVEELSDGPVVY